MAKPSKFDDPLNDIDPILAESFSEETQSTNIQDSLPEENYNSNSDVSNVSSVEFPELETSDSGVEIGNDMFHNIPVNLSVELGRSQVCLKDVYDLTEGSIIELDRLVGEPLDLVVNGQVIAQGEVVAIDNNYGLRVTSIVAKKAN